MSAIPVTFVGAGAFLRDSGMYGVHFVEKGGRVIHTGGNCVYFVKNGGKVEGGGGRAFIVREPQADLSIDVARGNTESNREVESVNLSIVPTTFTIVAP